MNYENLSKSELVKIVKRFECDLNQSGIDLNESKLNISKQANALKASEENSRAWLENSPVCTKIVDLDFTLKYMSRAGIKALHIDNIEEYYGKPYPFHFYPEFFRNEMRNNLSLVKKNGKMTSMEASVLDVDNNTLWFHSTLVPVRKDDDTLDYIMVLSVDITDRKKTEKELIAYRDNLEVEVEARTKNLKESEENYKTLVNNIPGMVYMANTDWSTKINSGSLLLTGYSEEDFDSGAVSWKDLIHPDDRDMVFSDGSSSLQSRKKNSVLEYRIKTKDSGFLKWVSDHKTYNYSEDGELSSVDGVVLDITDRKETEERMNYAEKVAKVGIWDWNLITDDLWWSDETYRTFGFEPNQFKPSYEVFDKALHPGDRERVNATVKDAVENSQPYNIENRIILPSGEVRWINSQGEVKRDHNNKVVGFYGIQNDITDKKIAEEQLIEAQKTTKVGHFSFRPVTNIVTGSDELFKIFGIEKGDDLLDEFVKKVHPDDSEFVQGKLQNAIELAEEFNMEHRLVMKDGSEKWIRAIGRVSTENQTTTQVFGTIQDTTEMKNIEKEKEKLYEQVERYNDDLKRLLYISSHDLRTPLVNIDGFSHDLVIEVNALFERLTNSNDINEAKKIIKEFSKTTLDKHVETIDESIFEMDSFIKGLLRLSRVGGRDVEKAMVSANDICRSIISEVKTENEGSHFSLEKSNLTNIYSDKFLLVTILKNLISNACKYLRPDTPGIVKISSIEEKDKVTYIVEDNGTGIPIEEQEKIFEFFYRSRSVGNILGTGIGLSIAKWATQKIGGDLYLKSTVGEGSTFYFSLPKE